MCNVEGKALGISDDFRRIEALADGFIDALERMGAEIVAQGLDEVGPDLGTAVPLCAVMFT